jgi:hypothetical protein
MRGIGREVAPGAVMRCSPPGQAGNGNIYYQAMASIIITYLIIGYLFILERKPANGT